MSLIESMPHRVRLYAQAVKPVLHLLRALPDERQSAHTWVMDLDDPVGIVAANLRALMDYARDRGDVDLASDKRLAERTGLARKTIQHMREGHNAAGEARAVGIDTLHRVAAAFDLAAYQLLIPRLNPRNPITVHVTELEGQLYAGIRRGSKLLRSTEGAENQEGGRRTPGARDRPRRDRARHARSVKVAASGGREPPDDQK